MVYIISFKINNIIKGTNNGRKRQAFKVLIFVKVYSHFCKFFIYGNIAGCLIKIVFMYLHEKSCCNIILMQYLKDNQVVFILTDGYLLDSVYEEEKLTLEAGTFSHRFVETAPGYLRYRLAEDGVSPRGVFGNGNGLVRIDSHEHDESGHIEEDFEMRERMQRKRMSKLDLLEKESIPPSVHGNPEGKSLVVCWGSTGPIVKEALDGLGWGDVALAHFSQVCPLPPSTGRLLGEAKKLLVVEGNSTGQFARLLRMHTGRKADHLLLNFRGHQFSVEEIARGLEKFLGGGDGR